MQQQAAAEGAWTTLMGTAKGKISDDNALDMHKPQAEWTVQPLEEDQVVSLI